MSPTRILYYKIDFNATSRLEFDKYYEIGGIWCYWGGEYGT